MKEGDRLTEHLKQMKEPTDQLSAIGAVIEEEDQIVTLLGSLHTKLCYNCDCTRNKD